jgi:hypothetical protein
MLIYVVGPIGADYRRYFANGEAAHVYAHTLNWPRAVDRPVASITTFTLDYEDDTLGRTAEDFGVRADARPGDFNRLFCESCNLNPVAAWNRGSPQHEAYQILCYACICSMQSNSDVIQRQPLLSSASQVREYLRHRRRENGLIETQARIVREFLVQEEIDDLVEYARRTGYDNPPMFGVCDNCRTNSITDNGTELGRIYCMPCISILIRQNIRHPLMTAEMRAQAEQYLRSQEKPREPLHYDDFPDIYGEGL